jgi:hypothetical protein
MTEVGTRDRLVMAGLVVLGLLTVVAGVLSGRSTINYVLGREAREAALSWAGKINTSLSEQGPHAPQMLDQNLEVLNANAFASQSGKQASLPASSTSKDDFTLVEEPRSADDRLGLEPPLPVSERVREQAARLRRAGARPLGQPIPSLPSTSPRRSSRPRMCMASCAGS